MMNEINDGQGDVNEVATGQGTDIGGNGHGESKALKASREVVPGGADAGGKKSEVSASRKELSRASFEHAFTQAGMPSALNMLVKPGDSTRDMTMRTFLPEKRTEAQRFATVVAYHLSKNRYFNCVNGEANVLDMLGLFVSIEGRGRSELTSAIIGDRRHEELQGGGIGSWLKKAAWGNKDEKKD